MTRRALDKLSVVIASRDDDRLFYWIAVTLLLTSFGLGDTAVIAWSASLLSLGQMAAGAMAFMLIGTGVLFTVWHMKQ